MRIFTIQFAKVIAILIETKYEFEIARKQHFNKNKEINFIIYLYFYFYSSILLKLIIFNTYIDKIDFDDNNMFID